MFKENDIKQITGRGATVKQVEAQVESFRKGFPWMKIVGPATPKRGIAVLSEDQVKAAAEYYDKAPSPANANSFRLPVPPPACSRTCSPA